MGIAAVLLLFFRECVKCMATLLEEEDELDDDLLMSEQFVHEQNERDKDKEKMALRKSRETNVSQYLFDIVSGRCQSVARAFFEWIDEAVWQALEEDVFKDVEQEKIRASVQPILDMKQLLNE